MRRFVIGIFTVLTLCLCLMTATASAATIASGNCGTGVRWTLTDDGTLTISGSGAMTNMANAAGYKWYTYKNSIKAVVVEKGVTVIGSNAFQDYTNLTTVTMPPTVTTIGSRTFRGCTGLQSVDIPSSVINIGEYAFYQCTGLESVNIPDSVTTIGAYAFCQCTGLESVVIPSSVAKINDGAFARCELTKVVFAGNAPTFGADVFKAVNATVEYPGNDSSWTAAVRQNYGGVLNWVEVCMNHSYGEPEWTWIGDDTNGYTAATATFTCNCGDSKNVAADISSVTNEPTVSESGAVTYTATVTFEDKEYTYTQTVEIPASGEGECKHSDLEYTDNGDGTHTVTCADCDVVIDAAEKHIDTDSDGACDSCDVELVLIDPSLTLFRDGATAPYAGMMVDNEIKIYVNVKKNSQYTGYYVKFSINNNGIKTTTAYPSSSSNNTYANFRFAVPAPLMTETISATVYGVKDGVVYRGNPVEFTVQESVFTQLDNAYKVYDTNLKAVKQIDLLLSLLKYGAEAQLQFEKNMDNLATDGLKDEYVALMKTTTPEFRDASPVDESGKEAVLNNMGLMLQEKINMYGNFKLQSAVTDLAAYTVVVEHTKSSGETVSYTMGHENLTVSEKYITFYFDKIAPSQMRDDIEITLYRNGEAVSATYTRTGDMIVKDVLSGNIALRDAIMNYADFAKVYFG